ncbi:hypothetical protein NPJ88_000400, partial [Halomonas elongata]|uniref:hypothetical protein n=1 Tax=Halomonas elongata TaxID=2746 RepID=UPI00255AE4B8
MKSEEKVFFSGVAVVVMVAIGYITYNSLGGDEPTRSSQIAFSSGSDSSGPQQPSETEGNARGDTNDTPQTDQREFPSQATEAPGSNGPENTARQGILRDPVPVPPAERSGDEIAQALRNLRVQAEAFQERLAVQGQTLRTLQQQINELKQAGQDYQEQLVAMQRSNEALRNDLSGQALYESSRPDTNAMESASKSDGYQLTKLFEDQAWILTPQGRTYIVGEGEWFEDEYIISIDNANHKVVT